MHQNLGYLFAAFAVTWAGLFGYIFLIQRALAEADARLRKLDGARSATVGGELPDRGGSA